MANKKSKRYSVSERRAYWIGYGAGIVGEGRSSSSLTDNRLGRGQVENLCKSARKGLFAGKKNAYSTHFEKGFKRYPVSLAKYLNRKN